VKLDVFPIAGLLMLRYPLLKSAAYPRGRLQPYAGVGPGAFVTTAKLDLTSLGAPDDFSDTTVNLGLDARAGVNLYFVKSWAVFWEYRFTHFEPSDFKDTIGVETIEFGSDQWNTHHVVGGVGWHF
jgi:opacity protein-like surface antigen